MRSVVSPSYNRNFVPNFSTIAAPLFDLTKRMPFISDEECRSAFEFLKLKLTTARSLRHRGTEKLRGRL